MQSAYLLIHAILGSLSGLLQAIPSRHDVHSLQQEACKLQQRSAGEPDQWAIPRKHKMLTQCCFDVGPPSNTAAQHQNTIGSTSRVHSATTAAAKLLRLSTPEVNLQRGRVPVRGAVASTSLDAERKPGSPNRLSG